MKKIYSLFLALFISTCVFAAGHTVSITSVNVQCYGTASGSATASVSGGVGPFTYDWSPMGATTATVTGLSTGTYSLVVTDNSDMSTATANVTITEPPLLAASITGGGVTICSGACTPLTVNATGGTPAYTYSWTPGGAMVPTYSACPIAGGQTYTVVVTDMNGCTAT
ncbi:MAG: SprB repeat-containing protein, partial [Bacteroidetes bacterium]|nr:SprB repeat-containing protein [Bacteroidota bacterium]